MTRQEKLAYDRHIDAIMIQNDVIDTAKLEGLVEGRAEGLAEGRSEGLVEGIEKGITEAKLTHARSLKAHGISNDIISDVTGLSIEEITKL